MSGGRRDDILVTYTRAMIPLVTLTALYLLGSDGLHLPNPHLTPGKTVTISKADLCSTKWGKDVRHVSLSMKKQVCLRYGVHACPGPSWEIDHLVSRELGGADDVANLWPQPIEEARKKDQLENRLHKLVCAGTVTLPAAQSAIREDWTRAYERFVAP